MNKNNLVLIGVGVVILLGLVFFFNRGNKPSSDATGNPNSAENSAVEQASSEETENTSLDASHDGVYDISATDSVITWEGRKPLVAGYRDYGVVMPKSGSLEIKDGLLVGGEIILDMANLRATEVAKGGAEGLTKHLKSEDFFAVEQYPEATVKLLSAKLVDPTDNDGEYTVETEMTIKGITQPVTLPISLYVNPDGQAVLSGVGELDRTLWDIRFGSGKFFQDLADRVIDDKFGVNFQFVANPKQ